MKFAAFKSTYHPNGAVGLVSGNGETIRPVLFPNSALVASLHHLIAQWDTVKDRLIPGQPEEKVDDVEILAPLRGRDILCVGKNYKEHAEEFHNSGYDSSDKKAQPDHPVIFTKRATSIIGNNVPIYPHPKATQSVDYEGELGIIIGKAGSQITKENAWDHVWGATIVNDMTARERQRDHKQFYIGKSLDTFCPMGPYAVHASALNFDKMILETKVNGATRQKQDTKELIFDIPTLIETCSLGITLQPGDVIATGTPAGVALSNGQFLKSGDKVEVSITGLGTLSNVVGDANDPYPSCEPVQAVQAYAVSAPDNKAVDLASSRLHVEVSGKEDGPAIVFIHGLGGGSQNFVPMITASNVEKTHKVIKFDLEGHGLSPLSGQDLSIPVYANSVKEVLDNAGVKQAVVVAHSMGGIIATTLAAQHPDLVTKLFLIGPVRQFPEAGFKALSGRAATVREGGMSAVSNVVATAGTSEKTKQNPLVIGYILSSLLATPAEGYALACLALARATNPGYAKIKAKTLIVAGDEDKTAPKATIDFLKEQIAGAEVKELQGVGHWIQLEDHLQTAELLKSFVQSNVSNGH